jgi:hypothetical protein
MLCVIMLNVGMLSVFMLSVVALTSKHQTRLEILARGKHSSLFGPFAINKKGFIRLAPRQHKSVIEWSHFWNL